MHDYDKLLRAALMTAHRYARGGYADRGFVEGETTYDPMGNVIVGGGSEDTSSPLYKAIEAASIGLGKAGAAVGEPLRRGAENYLGNVNQAFHESGEYAKQGLENTVSDKGPLYNTSGPLQYALGSMGQAFSPLTGAAMSAGQAATQLTGNPNIGSRVEFVGGLVDPSHAGALKTAARAAHEVSPVAVAAGKSAQRFEIPRAQNLSPEEIAIETRLADKISKDPQAAMDEYAKLKDTANGRILNTDNARELSTDYAANNDAKSRYSAAVHEPSSWLTKWMYEQKLKQPPAENQRPMVLFTAGGTGAGKTTAIENIPEMSSMADRSQIIFDTNMNGYKSSKTKIDQALDAGKEVGVVYVYRDPVEALVNGALPRAMRMGRTVPIGEHLKTHVESAATIRKLADEYADNPNVNFQVIDNSLGKGKAAVSSLDTIRPERYNLTIDDLKSALDDAYANNRISEAVYRGTIGSNFGGSGGKSSSVTPGKRAGGTVQKTAIKDGHEPYVSRSGSKSERENGKINAARILHDNHGRDLIGRALFVARKGGK